MSERILVHEVTLDGYKATADHKTLDFGTWGSYGIEKLHLNLGKAWEGLVILAHFNVKGEVVATALADEDNMIEVPWEALKDNTFAGRIVFQGDMNGARRLTANLNFKVTNHADFVGSDPVPTDDKWNQFVGETKGYRDDAVAAADAAKKSEANVEGMVQTPYNYIDESLRGWLDDHPEATTTVQDGAITEAKINGSFLPWIRNDYVTPEMFGAEGDGVADDDSSFLSMLKFAITNSKIVSLSRGKKYNIKSFTINKALIIKGNGSTLFFSDSGNGISIVPGTDVFRIDNGLSISDVVIECNNTANGLTIERADTSNISNVIIKDAADYGLKIVCCYNLSVSNLYVNGTKKHGIIIMPYVGETLTLGANANIFNNCRIEKYSAGGDYAGVYIGENCNGNSFNSLLVEFPNNYETSKAVGVEIYKADSSTFINPWLEHNYDEIRIDGGNFTTFIGGYYSIYGGNTRCVCYIKDGYAQFISPCIDQNTPLEYGGNSSLFVVAGAGYCDVSIDNASVPQNTIILAADNNGITTDAIKGQSLGGRAYGMVRYKSTYNANVLNIMFRSEYTKFRSDNTNYVDLSNGMPGIEHYNMYGNKSAANIMPVFAGALSDLPSGPIAGLMYFDVGSKKPMWFYNENWYYADGSSAT